MYYGLLFLTEAFQSGSYPILLSFEQSEPQVKVWGIYDGTNDALRIVFINKLISEGSVSVTFAPKYQVHGRNVGPVGELILMTAPSVYSETGIDYAGQTFDGSRDGKILGTRTPKVVQAQNGKFHFQLPNTALAMLVLRP
jgi:hypothetical protein